MNSSFCFLQYEECLEYFQHWNWIKFARSLLRSTAYRTTYFDNSVHHHLQIWTKFESFIFEILRFSHYRYRFFGPIHLPPFLSYLILSTKCPLWNELTFAVGGRLNSTLIWGLDISSLFATVNYIATNMPNHLSTFTLISKRYQIFFYFFTL